MQPQDHFFAELGDYDPSCCEECEKAHNAITKAKERVNTVQAASLLAGMPMEEMTLKVEITLKPVVNENRVECELITIIEKGAEKPSERKIAVLSTQLERVTKEVMRAWSMAYICNDGIDAIDTLMEQLRHDDDEGATNVGGSQSLN